MQICENTLGSYTCKCDADFKVDPANPKDCIGEFFKSIYQHCKDRRITC